ncbi:nuclease-related domain-containing protein [Limnohabitans sp. WS1]|uniref:nuclease-related domain-containing protein n=1 Tax=Limnohabitans sp. WS1 TaxID=1100726 RepID=UPI001304C494|nr:nuclease-related domain-containing protein [Limnohabitans sp. WS1]
MLIAYPYLLIAFAFCVLLGFGLGRYRDASFQNRGEALISKTIQANFAPPNFHLLNHITLQLQDGTTQVDHILVSKFGVFVIETKDYKGWIFANSKQATWTQVVFGRKFRFQNPIFQNMRHVQAVEKLLDFLPSSAIKSLVVFVGKAEFKTEKPPGVYAISELINYQQGHTEEVLSLNRVQFCVGRLETTRLAITRQTDLAHLQSLERRLGRKKLN